MRLRMVPLATLATRLHGAVRVTAREHAKAVEFVLEGEDIGSTKPCWKRWRSPCCTSCVTRWITASSHRLHGKHWGNPSKDRYIYGPFGKGHRSYSNCVMMGLVSTRNSSETAAIPAVSCRKQKPHRGRHDSSMPDLQTRIQYSAGSE